MEMIMRERSFKKDEVIYKKDAEPDFGYMIAKGQMEIFDCPEAILDESLGIGSFICEFDSFLNQKPLTMNLKAVTDVEGFEIARKDINQFFRNNPGLMLLVNKTKYIF